VFFFSLSLSSYSFLFVKSIAQVDMYNAGTRAFPRSDSYTTNGRTNGSGHGRGTGSGSGDGYGYSNGQTQTQGRLKDAPMDFQWTNRSPVKPVWKSEKEDASPSLQHPSSSSVLAPLSTNMTGRLAGRGAFLVCQNLL